ncbi:TonB-dependent receptor [Fluviicola sp. SGL-29]|nr:TonB-dependent receptor [Fluviicola sp. SGL-29]
MTRYYFFFLLFLPVITFGQTTVSGEVADSVTGQAMEFVSVKLFTEKDSVLKTGAYTDEKGKFIMDNIPGGNYYIVVGFSGYEDKQISSVKLTGQPVYSIGRVALAPVNLKQIDELVVVGKMEVLSAGIDKKVYNVDQDIVARGAGADEVLNNIPSITLDEEGRVSLRGEGSVTILINGQPSSLTGSGGDLLSSIPASTIERIEVVTNPSAKYDPDGTSGIINIVLKKNKVRGINGQIAATGGIPGHDHKLNAALSFRNDKLNVYGSYAFDYMEGYRNNFGDIERVIGTDSLMNLNQTRYGTDFKRGHMARLGLDWYLSNNSTFGISGNGQISARRRTGDQLNEQFIASESVTNEWVRRSEEPENRKGIDLNAYFNHNFKNELSKFSSSINYSTSDRTEDGYFSQDYRVFGGAITTMNTIYQNQYSASNDGIFTAQADYEQIVPKIKARYEVGIKAILRDEKLNSSSASYDYALQDFVTDTFATYDYKYNENVYSAYGTFGQELGKLKYQAGLRGEYVLQDPRLLSENKTYTKEYAQLYPSAHVRYATGERSEISFGYSRRINRPNSRDLNPFTNYSDPFNLRTGNPALKPEFIHSFDLGYTQTFKSMSLTGSVYYRHTTDVIQRVKIFYDDNTAAVTMANIDVSQTVGGELIFQFRPLPWWRNTISFNGNYIDYQNASTASDNWNNSGFNWGVKYNGSIDFWKKTATFQVNATYNAPRVTAQGIIYLWNFVDIAVQKQFFGKKFSVGVKLADVFNTKGFKMRIDQPTLRQYSDFDFQTRRVYLTLTYNFGKMEFSQKQLPKDTEGGGGDF